MAIRSYRGVGPTIPESAYVDEHALVIGNVTLGEGVSVWPGAVLRADDDSVCVGRGSAVMDQAFVEAPSGKPVTTGEGCLVSHGVRLHGCSLGSGVLVGVGAIVLDGARIGDGAIVGAGSLVTPGMEIGPGELVLGSPAKAMRRVTEEETSRIARELEAVKAKALDYKRNRPPR
ncbi:TPA: gamma carbonic anhydrase family protein [Thermoplasmata archaeon]|nr:gamma carbonic anhydrase family protein [Thermoplasmata archaeon]